MKRYAVMRLDGVGFILWTVEAISPTALLAGLGGWLLAAYARGASA